jgi:hypothetical protein
MMGLPDGLVSRLACVTNAELRFARPARPFKAGAGLK